MALAIVVGCDGFFGLDPFCCSGSEMPRIKLSTWLAFVLATTQVDCTGLALRVVRAAKSDTPTSR